MEKLLIDGYSKEHEADLLRVQKMIEEQAAKIKQLESILSTKDGRYSSEEAFHNNFYVDVRADESVQPSKPVILNQFSRSGGFPQRQHTQDQTKTEKLLKCDRPIEQQHILTRDERLEAHRRRKRTENKYSEESGKWDSPPPFQKHSTCVTRVRDNDELVRRLTSDPVQRKMIEVIEKRVRKNTNNYRCVMDRQETESDKRMSCNGKTRVSNHMTTKRKNSTRKACSISSSNGADKRRDALMQRLSMTLKDRRKLMKKQDDVPDTVKRSLRGHKLKKTSWTMADQFRNEYETEPDIEKEQSTMEIRCQTCQSMADCEEDIDNPGTYYCAMCWRKYESSMTISLNTINDIKANTKVDLMQLSDSCLGKQNNKEVDKNDDSIDIKSMKSRRVLDREGISYDTLNVRQNDVPNQKSKQYLWVMHDNHKLVQQVVCSGPKQMRCIVETKDPGRKNNIRMMIGLITYCGKLPKRRNTPMSDDCKIEQGSECLCISDLRGYCIDRDTVETRLSKDNQIYEFKLPLQNAVQLTGNQSTCTMKKFFEGCTGAVDVILDPQCSPGNWYPLKEAVGSMKIVAPQFRSRGVGYIRLGDDMGQNGLAFLSSDGCETFFSSFSKTTIYNEGNHLNRSLSLNNLYPNEMPSRRRAKSVGSLRPSTNVFTDYETTDDGSNDTNYDDDNISNVSEDEEEDDDDESVLEQDAGELLKQLQNLELSSDAKWKDKTELITKMGKVMKRRSSSSRINCSAVLNYLQDIIGAKNVNIHVLRVSLIAVGMIGHGIRSELASQIAWKTIMIEMLKLLKNKQVSSTVKDILRDMHRYNAFTLSSSLPLIAHVLGVGKTAPRANANAPKLKKLSSTSSPLTEVQTQNSNNTDVIEWLAEATEVERTMKYIDPIMDESSLSTLAHFFINFCGHRDATCRKNACDGLLHTLLYGVARLRIMFDDCCVLCGKESMEASHPKIWAQIHKAARLILKEESTKI